MDKDKIEEFIGKTNIRIVCETARSTQFYTARIVISLNEGTLKIRDKFNYTQLIEVGSISQIGYLNKEVD